MDPKTSFAYRAFDFDIQGCRQVITKMKKAASSAKPRRECNLKGGVIQGPFNSRTGPQYVLVTSVDPFYHRFVKNDAEPLWTTTSHIPGVRY
jgi:hypothetical protein